jgi:hypothetical protein
MGYYGKGKGKGKGSIPDIFECPINAAPVESPVSAPKRSPVATPPLESETPSASPFLNIIPTCSDGSVGPMDESNCVSVCPETGIRPSFCTERCPANDQIPSGPCAVICDPGSNSVPKGCNEACCPEDVTDIPTTSPVLPIRITCPDGSVVLAHLMALNVWMSVPTTIR